MPDREMVSIFVQISSYRDRELTKTIEDAVAKSSKQYDITFGVHEIIAPEESSTALPKNIRYAYSVAPENIGVNKGRAIANAFYAGEDYYYQIDSHMRFVQDWDIKAIHSIKQYQKLGIAKPLLTMYPGNFWYENGIEHFDAIDTFIPTKISFHEKPQDFAEKLIPSQMAIVADPECAFTFSVSAANIFTLGEFAYLPRDTRIAFWGEEILTAATAFCYGFDLLLPHTYLAWHLYHSGQTYEQIGRRHAWADYPSEWAALVSASDGALAESLSSLAGIRALQEFGDFSGLDFVNRCLIGHQLEYKS